MKRNDEIVTWGGLHGTAEAKVRVRTFDDMVFRGRTVAVLTEPDDNPSTSVTNGVEMIAALVCERFKLCPANVTFIEHYPGDETVDVVTFAAGPVDDYRPGRGTIKTFQTPSWARVDWPMLRTLIVDVAEYPGSAPSGLDEF